MKYTEPRDAASRAPTTAAATVVTAPCNRTVVAGVAALPCAMVVVVVAVHHVCRVGSRHHCRLLLRRCCVR
jgi:hypothetical protein